MNPRAALLQGKPALPGVSGTGVRGGFLSERWRLPGSSVLAASYAYLVLPLVVFAFGWLRSGYAALFSLILLTATWKAMRHAVLDDSERAPTLRLILGAFLVAAVWVLSSGIGGFAAQSTDFAARNAIFRDLITHPWPLRYEYHEIPLLRAAVGEHGVMIYNLAYWLPSALVGKAFGWAAANVALYTWSVFGVALTLLLLARFSGGDSPWILVIFAFWSGLDLVGRVALMAIGGSPAGAILAGILSGAHLEWWSWPLQYSSHTTQLFYVFNQALPAWLVTLLLIGRLRRADVLFVYSLVLLYAPLPAVGLAPIVMWRVLDGITLRPVSGLARRLASRVREVAAPYSLLAAAALSLVAALYLSAGAGSYPRGLLWQQYPAPANGTPLVEIYLLFCLLEVFPLALLAWDPDARGLWVTCLASLMLLPLYSYGAFNDLVTRASIPALLVLCALLTRKIQQLGRPSWSLRNAMRLALAVLILSIGALTTLDELLHTRYVLVNRGSPVADGWRTFDDASGPSDKIASLPGFIIGDSGGILFFRTLGKESSPD